MRACWWPAAALALACPLALGQTCTVAVTPLAFGNYASPQGPRVDSSATVQVRCTPAYLLLACQVGYTLSLSAGLSPVGGARQLSAGTGLLRYDLYSDAARTVAWGDGGVSGSTVAGSISTGLLGLVCLQGSRSHTLYGRIPASQNVPVGVYQDQVVLTVTY
jgi:spore coat protein U-like protein